MEENGSHDCDIVHFTALYRRLFFTLVGLLLILFYSQQCKKLRYFILDQDILKALFSLIRILNIAF